MLSSVETIRTINTLVRKETPFLFIISFDKENNLVYPISELKQNNIFFRTPFYNNLDIQQGLTLGNFEKCPIDFQEYKVLFDKVLSEIKKGNSFLLNLTVPTNVKSDLDLFQIFSISEAPYKLYCQDAFTCFSPESFVGIEGNVIKTFPMKGTINANVPDALQSIMNDAKEAAEHATIVDLLRNDLSIVASNVKVARYRYPDLIRTNFGSIYQISSEISGELEPDFKSRLGEIIFALLPAGSVTGAPKSKTVQIIEQVELCQRGFYTGVFGVWDTKKLDSAVMIRFIQNKNGNLVYHSGGGITFQSESLPEYNELIDKVYVPVR